MPKLDGTHIVGRLQKRIAELEAGQEVAARDIKALLTADQMQALDAAWTEQQLLRKQKGAPATGGIGVPVWKSKRGLRLEAFKQALCDAKRDERAAWQEKLFDAEVRQGRVYFDALDVAEEAGRDKHDAKTWANNELTRAGLRRLDGVAVARIDPRAREMAALERKLYVHGMDHDDLEEFEMWEAAQVKQRRNE